MLLTVVGLRDKPVVALSVCLWLSGRINLVSLLRRCFLGYQMMTGRERCEKMWTKPTICPFPIVHWLKLTDWWTPTVDLNCQILCVTLALEIRLEKYWSQSNYIGQTLKMRIRQSERHSQMTSLDVDMVTCMCSQAKLPQSNTFNNLRKVVKRDRRVVKCSPIEICENP